MAGTQGLESSLAASSVHISKNLELQAEPELELQTFDMRSVPSSIVTTAPSTYPYFIYFYFLKIHFFI